jgi:hypothetical protein
VVIRSILIGGLVVIEHSTLTPKHPGCHFVAFGWVQWAIEHTKRAFFIQKRAVKLGW